MPYSRNLKGTKDNLKELRCKQYGNRLYYFFKGDDIYIILNGGKKNTQDKDIKKAEKIISNFKKEWL